MPPGAPGWAPHCKAQLELGTVAPTCSLAGRCSALTKHGLKGIFDLALKAVLTPPPRPPLKRGWLVPRALRSLLS